MKIYTYSKSILGVIFAATLLIGVAHAQTSSVTTGSELESTGTISDYTPGSALVLDIGTGELVQFQLSQNVVYADPEGTVLEAPRVKHDRKNPRLLHQSRRRQCGG